MRYFVTGASGFIGSRLTRRLLEAGHEVTALKWTEDPGDDIPLGAEVVEGDVRDKASIREAMAGADGVFHLAAWFYVGPGPRFVETAESINVGGTRNVLELMAELEVPKGVYTSTVAVYPSTDRVIDEDHRPRRPDTSVYDRTKWSAHYEVAQPMVDDGLPLVIVLPGGVYGPGDKLTGSVRGVFQAYLRRSLPIIPRHGVYSPFDYVDDTAENIRLAMERGEPGETYIVSGEPRWLAEVLETAEAITGVPVPRAVSPRWFQALAWVMAGVERVVTPPTGFESETLRVFADSRIPVDNAKAKRELGITHRPLEEGLRAYFAWERAQLDGAA